MSKRTKASDEARAAEMLASQANMALTELTGTHILALEKTLEWLTTARPKQMEAFAAAADVIWYRCGRGWGKSRTLVEWVVQKLLWSGIQNCRVAVVGRTAGDVTETLLDSPAGIFNCLPAGAIIKHDKNNGSYRLFNGSYFRTFSSEQPNSLRGPNFHFGAGDETSSWRYMEALTNLELVVRLGQSPQILHTTTPKRNDITRYLAKTRGIFVVSGGTAENKDNLSARWVDNIHRKYAGTHIERQELYGEVLDESPGALFTRENIEYHRIDFDSVPQEFERVVVSIDPQAVQSEEEREFDMGSETGIVVGGSQYDKEGKLHIYILSDESLRARPAGWAAAACAARRRYNADYYLAETNQGGDMVTEVIRQADNSVRVRTVHQTKGKRLRAEEVSFLYEKGHVHHCGNLAELEDQMCTWTGFPGSREKSPDRLDALTQLVAELGIDNISGERIVII